MEQIPMQSNKLPNVNTSIILSVCSFIGCCCTSGILGVVLGYLAFNYARKDELLYEQNPGLYENYSQLKTAKILSIVALVLSGITLLNLIYSIITGDIQNQMEELRQQLEELQGQYE